MTPRRPQRPIRAVFVPNPLWWWAVGRLLAPHARHFEARRRRRAAARAVRRGHGVALDLRIQCHRLSDAALVITAPGRLVLFAQRSPWRGSSRLDVPDLRPAQTRTATSPHPPQPHERRQPRARPCVGRVVCDGPWGQCGITRPALGHIGGAEHTSGLNICSIPLKTRQSRPGTRPAA